MTVQLFRMVVTIFGMGLSTTAMRLSRFRLYRMVLSSPMTIGTIISVEPQPVEAVLSLPTRVRVGQPMSGLAIPLRIQLTMPVVSQMTMTVRP